MNKGITVKELMECCSEQIKIGNGDKYIIISDDDEGNGYHTLFYAFSNDQDLIREALNLEHDNHSEDEVVVLG